MLPNSLARLFFGKWGKVISMTIIALFIVGIVKLCWDNYTFFTRKTEVAAIDQRPSFNQSKHDYAKIQQAHFFGEFLPDNLNNESIKKSMLNLKLVGTMEAYPEKYSQVILALPGGKEKIFSLGDKIPGGAKIVKILTDGVLILRNGQVERISMPKLGVKFEPVPRSLTMENY